MSEQNQADSNTPASNVPDSFQVTRNGVTLEYVKVPAKRKGKGGKTLPPVFCPQIEPTTEQVKEIIRQNELLRDKAKAADVKGYDDPDSENFIMTIDSEAAYEIALSTNLQNYRVFCGEELFIADLQASIYQRCIRQQQKFTADGKETSCWSADGTKFDEETAIRNAQLASVKAETTSDLMDEMKSIAEEFTKANAEGNATRVAELMGMMAENLQKQASKKHSK